VHIRESVGVNLAGPDRETAVDRVVGALMERERVLAGGVHEKVGLKLLAVNWLVGAQALGGAGGPSLYGRLSSCHRRPRGLRARRLLRVPQWATDCLLLRRSLAAASIFASIFWMMRSRAAGGLARSRVL
jgi:hypothetical protein